MVEITARTVGARYLLAPTPELTGRILGCIGRTLSLVPIDLHAFAFLSNHWHALVSSPDALAVTCFVQQIHSKVALAVKQVHGWDGKVFGRSAQVVVAEDAQLDRLRYVLSQGAKEGLVATPYDWPGAHCARALAGFEELTGIWIDRTRAAQLRRGGGRGGGRDASSGELVRTYPIPLAPLPIWSELDAAERQLRVRTMIDEIVEAAAIAHPRPLGVDLVIAQPPFSQPAKPKRARAPAIHTKDMEIRAMFYAEKRSFTRRHRMASDELRLGRPTLVPAMCFPPRAPFFVDAGALWASRGKKGEKK